jgi:hypothetical protein
MQDIDNSLHISGEPTALGGGRLSDCPIDVQLPNPLAIERFSAKRAVFWVKGFNAA